MSLALVTAALFVSALAAWVPSAGLAFDLNPFNDRPWERWGECELAGELPHTCVFDSERCLGPCGTELSAFTDAVDAWIEERFDCGRRHCPSWTLRLYGQIEIDPAEPWELRADRVRVDCHSAQLLVRRVPPTRRLQGLTLVPGTRNYERPGANRELAPGDVLLGPAGWQGVVRKATAEGFELGWPWQGPEVRDPRASYGRVVRLAGEAITFADVCPVYGMSGTQWRRGQRDVPMTVIETPGWDLESGFCPEGFDHPGDYGLAVTSGSPGGGTNGTRILCMPTSNQQHAHADLVAAGEHVGGAAVLALGNTVDMRGLRRQMAFNFRSFIVVGGHKVELRGAGEGAGQLLWCPQGCSSVSIDGLMNHQNSPEVPRTFPWIDLGHATRVSHVRVAAPFWFFQWGAANERRLLVRGTGKPAYVLLEGVVRNVDAKRFASGGLFELPPGSIVNGRRMYCDDCGTDQPTGEIRP